MFTVLDEWTKMEREGFEDMLRLLVYNKRIGSAGTCWTYTQDINSIMREYLCSAPGVRGAQYTMYEHI